MPDNFDEWLMVLCPKHGYSFKSADFNKLCQPIVYLFLGKRDKPLYVGMSKNGVGRPASPTHGAAMVRLESEKVLVYPCRSVKVAQRLEQFLIHKMQPVFNIRTNPVRSAKAFKQFESALHTHSESETIQ